MTFVPQQSSVTKLGGTEIKDGAIGWQVSPAANVNGLDIGTLLVKRSGNDATIYVGSDTVTPTANLPLGMSISGENAYIQGLRLPAGYGVYVDGSGALIDMSYDLL
ncbi:hypothetical protein [Kordiimonas marina]|uniref:hypothetical protein n=1 Tax=Kordiimonas marina TaxID=2872312 RepID=UPI001FF6B8F2|nr:hypothetical protein [Kordiimonas marina]MCJ9428542.1 hypothetical protein [Kordiimonas marina]